MTHATLASHLWPSSSILRNVVLAVAGSLVVAAAAQITVPMWPVPMTLQTLAVLGIGGAYGMQLGAATLGLYALEGAVGLPFFAGGKSGLFDAKLDYLLPSGSMGYVAGFILAAALVGYLVEKGWGASLFKATLAAVLGAILLYVPGIAWLSVWAAKTGAVPEGMSALQAALSWGLYPFVAGDALKAVIAGLSIPLVGKLVERH